MMTYPTDGAKMGPIMAADCSTVITFLKVLPENVSLIIAVVTVRIIPFPRLASPLTTIKKSTLPANVQRKVNKRLKPTPDANTGFLPYLSLIGPPISVPIAVAIIPAVNVRLR